MYTINKNKIFHKFEIFSLVITSVLLLIIIFSGLFLLTIGFDEAWILQGIDALNTEYNVVNCESSVLTSGGIYVFSNMVVQKLFGNSLIMHRLLSFISVLLLFSFLYLFSEKKKNAVSFFSPFIILMGFPGSIFLAASAYANYQALLLFIIAIEVLKKQMYTLKYSILTGLLLGLTIATRTEFLFGLIGVLLWILLKKETLQWKILNILTISISTVIAIIISAEIVIIMTPRAIDIKKYFWSTGASNYLLNYPAFLNKWQLSSDRFFIPIGILSSIIALYSRSNCEKETLSPRFVYIITAWLIWGAWLIASPFSHLRYIWYSYALFALVICEGVKEIYYKSYKKNNLFLQVAILSLVLSFGLAGLGSGFRLILLGDSNLLTAESSGYSEHSYFRRFQFIKEQRSIVKYLKENVDSNEKIGVIGAKRELEYLVGNRFVSLINISKEDYKAEISTISRIIIPPDTYYYINYECRSWIKENCILEIQIGRYSLYKVIGSFPIEKKDFVSAGYSSQIVHPLSEITIGTKRE